MKNGLKPIWHSYQSGLKVILLSVVESTVSVSKSIRPESVSTISVTPVVPRIGSSLGLSLSLTLAVVAKTVSTVVSSKTVSVSQSVSSVAIEVRISSSLCFGFRLGGNDGRQGENYELEKTRFEIF